MPYAALPLFVVVSGLPASGKSTLGRALAAALSLPLVDNDTFLEASYATATPACVADRERLSRIADEQFREAAQSQAGAVLAAEWRHPSSDATAGTPATWLRALPGKVLEVHCRCPASVALKRFLSRTHPPIHHDAGHSRDVLAHQFVAAESLGPLNLFPTIGVDTTHNPDIAALRREIEIDRIYFPGR